MMPKSKGCWCWIGGEQGEWVKGCQMSKVNLDPPDCGSRLEVFACYPILKCQSKDRVDWDSY